MKLETALEDGALVVTPEGSIDSSNASAFYSALIDATKDTGDALVLNMERLTYLSSPGLRVMLRITRALRGRGIKFLICAPSHMVGQVLEITGFDRIIETHKTRAGAIVSLRN